MKQVSLKEFGALLDEKERVEENDLSYFFALCGIILVLAVVQLSLNIDIEKFKQNELLKFLLSMKIFYSALSISCFSRAYVLSKQQEIKQKIEQEIMKIGTK